MMSVVAFGFRTYSRGAISRGIGDNTTIQNNNNNNYNYSNDNNILIARCPTGKSVCTGRRHRCIIIMIR